MRDLSVAFIAQLAAGAKTAALFFEADFATGRVNLWTGLGEIAWDGKTWTGAGSVISISAAEETADTKARGLTLRLDGIPSSLLSLILAEVRQGKAGRVWLGFLDDGGAVIADPALSFTGRLDVPAIADDGQSLTVTLAYENRLRDLERPRELHYTDQSQKLRFAADRGFEYVTSLQEWTGEWGQS